MKRPRVGVLIPCRDEQETAAPLALSCLRVLDARGTDCEIIFVDDGSSDETAAHIEKEAARDPRIKLVRFARSFGQTAAIKAAVDYSTAEILIPMDGDLQNDPRDIPKLVSRLLIEDLDMVAGWRQKRQDGFLLRKLPSMIANRLIRKVSGLEFKDLGCSLKAFRGDVLRQVRLYGEMHRFIPAWLATVTSPDRMAEEPVRHHARRMGESKYGISRTFRVIVDLLAMHYFLRFGTRPGHFFGGFGLILSAIGGLMLAYLGVLKLLGEDVGGRPLLWLGFFSVLAGVQMLTTGVLAEILMRSYFDQSGARSYQVMRPDPRSIEEGWHDQDAADAAV